MSKRSAVRRSLYEVEGSTANVESKVIHIAARTCSEAERVAVQDFYFTRVASVRQKEFSVWVSK